MKYYKKNNWKNNGDKNSKKEIINNLSTTNQINNLSYSGINLSSSNINPVMQNFMNNINPVNSQKNLLENNKVNNSNNISLNNENNKNSNGENLNCPQPIIQ